MEKKEFYAVPWIEIEYGWGDRPEGYKIFDNLEDCINTTKEDSKNGSYSGGYIGPIRPLYYYKIPYNVDLKPHSFIDTLEYKSEQIKIN